jgi:hypothetical protein
VILLSEVLNHCVKQCLLKPANRLDMLQGEWVVMLEGLVRIRNLSGWAMQCVLHYMPARSDRR